MSLDERINRSMTSRENGEAIGRFLVGDLSVQVGVSNSMRHWRSEVIEMKKPFGFEFLTIVAILLIVMGWVGYRMLTRASQVEPRVMLVNDKVQATYNVEYGRVENTSLRLDVYQPTGWSISSRPAILLIHGGGWIEGDKAGESDLASWLVPQGFVAFAVNYRLTQNGRNEYPAALLDVRRAVRWIRVHAHEYGVDPARIGAVGLSAGGHLAAILGTTDRTDPADPNSGLVSSRVACVVDTAGPTDFTDDANPPAGQRIAQVIPLFFGKIRDQIPEAYRDGSPALHVDAQTAPTLILHGTADDIVPIGQSERFEQALRSAGIEVKFVKFDGEGHSFVQPTHQRRWLDEMAGWLVDHLNP